MLSIILKSPTEITEETGLRARSRRLSANLTQEGLSSRAGVSLGTLKMFERTGKASFETVVRVAFALDAVGEFETLFPSAPVTRIQDVIDAPTRRRGRRK